MVATEAKRTDFQRGQALLVSLAALLAMMLGASLLFSLGRALAGKGRTQQAADLAALPWRSKPDARTECSSAPATCASPAAGEGRQRA